MADTLSVYDVGGGGVNLVKSPLQLADNEATQLQNAEYDADQSSGGQFALSKRGGLAPLNSALAGAIYGIVGMPLKTSYTRTLYAARGSATANTFTKSTNGTSWANTATPLAPALDSKFTDANGQRDARRAISFANFILYLYDTYTKGTDKPPIALFDGTAALNLTTIPFGPSATATTPAYSISDMIVANGKIYFAVHDPGGSAPALAGRVMSLNLTTGVIAQIASPFGNGTGEQAGGYPSALCWYQNQLFVGLNGSSTTDGIGTVVRCYPDIDTTWTSDTAALVSHISSICVFLGDLYVATQASVSTAAKIYKRAATTGAYTAQLTSTGAGSGGHYASLIVYASEIYAAEYASTGTIIHIKKSADGTTWTTDRDVDATDGGAVGNRPGSAVVFANGVDLYYVFRATGVSAVDGFIMRKTAGTWTKVLTDNLGGPIVTLVERS